MSACLRWAVAFALLVPAQAAYAQTNDRGGLSVRELSVATGYSFVQLPPLTLGGRLPDDALHEDLITSGAVTIDWQRITSRTRYTFELFGAYTARARYAGLSAPGGSVTFDVTRALGNRWRLRAGIAHAITSSDLLAFQPAAGAAAGGYGDSSAPVGLARSPHPDPAQAALFVPISQSLLASDLFGNRSLVSRSTATATYAHSARLATVVRGSYGIIRRITSNREPGRTLPSQDSNAGSVDVRVRYDHSERTRVGAGLNWSQISGVSADRVLSATADYAWSGRKWFTDASVGAALRPFDTAQAGAPSTTDSTRPFIVYRGAIGYRFRTQALLVQYSRAPHDEFGQGGSNAVTGFEGDVQSVTGSWSWSASRTGWLARSDLSLVRRPGNFSYIYTWLATGSVGRRLGPNVRLMAEFQFDRHGSRGFEGFHLSREGARLNLVWIPARRVVE